MMSKRGLCLAILMTSLLSLGSAVQAEEPLYLLFFGNSFTIGGGGVYNLVGSLAVSDGHVAPVIVADVEGGKDLDYHLGQVQNYASNNVTNSALPDGETWDYVIMQGYSTEATSLSSDDFDGDALALYNAVANHSSGNGDGVTAILYQTWARWDMIDDGYYSGNMDAMQDDIAAGYQSACDTITDSGGSCGIATVGQAFGLMDYDTSLYGDDDYHASNTGYLLAAMVIYRTIYGEDVSDIAYDSSYGVSSSVWATLVATADAAPIVSTTPEPASLSLLGLGALALLKRRR